MTGEAREVRSEDAFDVARVARWLQQHAVSEVVESMPAGSLAEMPQVQQFPGGASNLTYLLRYPNVDLILRRPPVGTKAAGAHDMAREYQVQLALRPHWPLVPQMVGLCQDDAVIGSDFYVMKRLQGPIPRRDLPDGVHLDQAGAAALCEEFVTTLAGLHALDPAVVGLKGLDRGPGYVHRQVAGWTARCQRAAVEGLPDFADVTTWLAEREPDDVARVVIHNDFRLDNVVLDPDDPRRIIGVLDWEMATVGDPLMDLGGAMAYWVQADDSAAFKEFRRQPSHLPGMFTREQIVESYCAATGRTVTAEEWLFYEVFGLFRLAVIALQIYYRYANGQTTNAAYAPFGPATTMLYDRCRALITAAV